VSRPLKFLSIINSVTRPNYAAQSPDRITRQYLITPVLYRLRFQKDVSQTPQDWADYYQWSWPAAPAAAPPPPRMHRHPNSCTAALVAATPPPRLHCHPRRPRPPSRLHRRRRSRRRPRGCTAAPAPAAEGAASEVKGLARPPPRIREHAARTAPGPPAPPQPQLLPLLKEPPARRRAGGSRSVGPRARLQALVHILSSPRECHAGWATPRCSAPRSVDARRYAVWSRGVLRVAHSAKPRGANACRRIAARASVHGLTERVDHFNPLFYARLGNV
jgi:hypothetical protein